MLTIKEHIVSKHVHPTRLTTPDIVDMWAGDTYFMREIRKRNGLRKCPTSGNR